MPHKKTAAFIVKLANDPKLRERFKKDPDATMKAHDVPEASRAVLKRGNPDEVRKHLGDDSPPGCFVLC
jgi:hypothetical protein